MKRRTKAEFSSKMQIYINIQNKDLNGYFTDKSKHGNEINKVKKINNKITLRTYFHELTTTFNKLHIQ